MSSTIREAIERYWFPEGHVNEAQRDFLVDLLHRERPRACLETGFASGRSAVTTLVAAQPDVLVSVDLSLDYLAGAREHAERLQRDFPNLKVIEGDSAHILKPDFFAAHFPQGVDYAFVDGNHTYRGCAADVSAILPHLSARGLIVVDDYRAGPPKGARCPSVDAAVDDIVVRHRLALTVWQRDGKSVAILRQHGPWLARWFLVLARVARRRVREVPAFGRGRAVRGWAVGRRAWRRYVPDAATRRFIAYNRRRWRGWRVQQLTSEILLDYYTVPQTQIARSYFLNVLARQNQAGLAVFMDNARRSVAPADWRVMRSYNVTGRVAPVLSEAQQREVDGLLEQIMPLADKRALFDLTVRGVWVGIDVYESYLKGGRPTVDLSDLLIEQLLRAALSQLIFWQDYFNKHTVAAVIVGHDCYVYPNVVCKVAYQRGVPVYLPNVRSVTRTSRPFESWGFMRDYRRLFGALPVAEQQRGRAWAKRQLERRMAGEVGVDMPYARVSAWEAPNQARRVLRASDRLKVLICSHCFYDNPHGFGGMLFVDFFEWLSYLRDVALRTDYDWYLKVHPDPLPGTEETVRGILGADSPITVLPHTVSHRQLAADGLNVVLTAYGTVGHEYPALGVPVVNAGYNPRVAYDFNVHPPSREEYEQILLNLKNLRVNIDPDQLYEFYFMHHRYILADDLVMDSYERFTEAVTPAAQLDSRAYDWWLDRQTDEQRAKTIDRLKSWLASSNKRYLFRYGPVP
ncbi:MAG: class I SAM-dependent methyltransferase [Candidatus Andersenbacteria bacterium]|nr:class I SAM-dependent methyltransferase [Candidatus Andersenbacteria bacterium]